MQGQLLEHDTTVCAVSLLLDDELPGHGLWGKALADTFPGIQHGHIAVHHLSHVSVTAVAALPLQPCNSLTDMIGGVFNANTMIAEYCNRHIVGVSHLQHINIY
jgi:hypothetical protein